MLVVCYILKRGGRNSEKVEDSDGQPRKFGSALAKKRAQAIEAATAGQQYWAAVREQHAKGEFVSVLKKAPSMNRRKSAPDLRMDEEPPGAALLRSSRASKFSSAPDEGKSEGSRPGSRSGSRSSRRHSGAVGRYM